MWLTVPDVAERLGLPLSAVRRLIEDRELLSHRIGERRVLAVPEGFLDAEGPLPALKGTVTVLNDGGMTDVEAIRWLHTRDDTLPVPGDARSRRSTPASRPRCAAARWRRPSRPCPVGPGASPSGGAGRRDVDEAVEDGSRASASTDGPRRARRAPSRAEGRPISVLEDVDRARARDDAAQLVDRGPVEVGPADELLEPAAPRVVGAREGVGEQDGALALAQVVAGGLAGGLGVAEDAEEVVAQLERAAEVEPVAREGRRCPPRRARRWRRR